MARVLLPLPDIDFDTTEVAVPWKVLTEAGHEVAFATEHGGIRPSCDPRLLDGVIFGQLGATAEAKELYAELLDDPLFNAPSAWTAADPEQVDALLLPGGHAPGMRQYLGSKELQGLVGAIWASDKPVGAICHGPVVLARTLHPGTGRSVLEGRRSTALPKAMERGAYLATAWRLGRYYRTYPTYVADEVRSAIGTKGQFLKGPGGTKRDSRSKGQSGFTVLDGHYLSARWPGDAWTFANRFVDLLG